MLGCHDYRNFCKINMSTANHHVRRVLKAQVSPSKINQNMAELEITSTGFLYHQIRLTVTYLLQIGVGNEDPYLVKQLLDVETHPQRPAMHMASDVPLILTECHFENEENTLNWICTEPERVGVRKCLARLWFEKMNEAQQVQIHNASKNELFTFCSRDKRSLCILHTFECIPRHNRRGHLQ
jgi:hypothetical protein